MASTYQRARRYAFWRGFAFTLTAITLFALASGMADRISNGVPL